MIPDGPTEHAGSLAGADRARRLGPGAAGAGKRDRPGLDARFRRPLGGLPAHDAVGQRARRRPSRRPDGQLRGWAPQPGRGIDRRAGPDPDRRRDRRRQLLREPRAARRLRGGPLRAPRAPAPDGPRIRRRRPLGLGAHRGVHRDGRPRGCARLGGACVHGRPRHAADGGRRLHPGAGALATSRRTDRHGVRPLLRHGPRSPLGQDRARLRRDRGRPGAAGRERRGRDQRRLRTRRDRRVRAPARDRRLRRGRGRRRGPAFQLPPGPGTATRAGAGRAGLRRVLPRSRPPGSPGHADRVSRGMEVSGRLCAPSSGDDAGRGDRRAAGTASCTSPRPRSTPTSRISSTAVARTSGRERSAAWCPRYATFPPTTTRPR